MVEKEPPLKRASLLEGGVLDFDLMELGSPVVVLCHGRGDAMVVAQSDVLSREGVGRCGCVLGCGGLRVGAWLYSQDAVLHQHGDGGPVGTSSRRLVEHLPLAPNLELPRQFVLVESEGRAGFFAVQARVAQAPLPKGVHDLNLPVGRRPHALRLPKGQVVVIFRGRQLVRTRFARVAAAQGCPMGHGGIIWRAVET